MPRQPHRKKGCPPFAPLHFCHNRFRHKHFARDLRAKKNRIVNRNANHAKSARRGAEIHRDFIADLRAQRLDQIGRNHRAIRFVRVQPTTLHHLRLVQGRGHRNAPQPRARRLARIFSGARDPHILQGPDFGLLHARHGQQCRAHIVAHVFAEPEPRVRAIRAKQIVNRRVHRHAHRLRGKRRCNGDANNQHCHQRARFAPREIANRHCRERRQGNNFLQRSVNASRAVRRRNAV
ncbi:MAG: hypothetical protein HDKAJFGB_00841 [Anaerolineae bacterium]|nr:hypothetical protein [Anaerolineae bacterium]